MADARRARGLRARSSRGQFGQTWWGRLLADRIAGVVDEGRLERGRSYARGGRVLGLDLSGPRVVGTVSGSEARPYTATVSFSSLAEDGRALREAVGAQPGLAATLLSGVMPDELAEPAVGLFPTHRDELTVTCSCPDFASPCKHAAAVLLLLVERVDAAPATLLRLRGVDVDALIGVATDEDGADDDLADSVADFWRPRSAVTAPEVRFRPVIEDLEPALLRAALRNGLPAGPMGTPLNEAMAYLADCYRRLQ